MVDAKAAVNEALPTITETTLKTEVELTMQAYADGITVYNLALKDGGERFFVDGMNRQATQLNTLYGLTRKSGGIVWTKDALPAIWRVASIHLQCAMDLAK